MTMSDLQQTLKTWLLKSIHLFIIVGMIIVLAVVHNNEQTIKEVAPKIPKFFLETSVPMDVDREFQCLVRNVYWESGSEPYAGKVAVAQVTLNRVTSKRFPNSICGVVYQRTTFVDRVICQFSWTCVDSLKPINRALWQESEQAAREVLFEDQRNPQLNRALYFHADYVNANWPRKRLDKIGRHVFYGDH